MLSLKNVRILSFLCDLAEGGKAATIADVAAFAHISTRMVRYNLDQIDDYLQENGFQGTRQKKSSGVELCVDRSELDRIRATMKNIQNNIYVLSRQERELYVLLELFDLEEPIRYEELGETLSVSRKTVIEDVRNIRETDAALATGISPTKYGIVFTGGELCIRKTIIDRLLELYTLPDLWKILSGDSVNKSIPIEKRIISLTQGVDTKLFEQVLRGIEKTCDMLFTDETYYLLATLAAFSVLRFRSGHVAEAAQTRQETEISRDVDNLLQGLETVMDVRLPRSEREYIDSELHRILNLAHTEQAENMSLVVTEGLISEVSRYQRHDFSSDDNLRHDLQRHLFEFLKSSRKQRELDGVTIATLVRGNEDLLRCIRKSLIDLTGLDEHVCDEQECALIMLHFFASYERGRVRTFRPCSVLVVCTNGLGSARLVSAKLQNNFPQLRVVNITSIHNMRKAIETERPDLILTTISLAEQEDIPVIRVSPLLDQKDLERVRTFVTEYTGSRKNENAEQYARAMELINRTCEVRDEEDLDDGLRSIFSLGRSDSAQNALNLSQMIRPEYIRLGVEAEDWTDAIRKSAAPMMESGDFTEEYVDAMIQNIRDNGPYVVIARGIALPHAMPRYGVKRSCIGMTVLRTPVEFGNKANDPVRLVICMGTLDNQEHMKSISQLLSVVDDPTVLSYIERAQTRRQILDLLERYC